MHPQSDILKQVHKICLSGPELPPPYPRWQQQIELHRSDRRKALRVNRIRHPAAVRIAQSNRTPQSSGE